MAKKMLRKYPAALIWYITHNIVLFELLRVNCWWLEIASKSLLMKTIFNS